MRAVFAGLTLRARCLIGAGLSAVLCGMLLGEPDLIRAGVLGLALPLVCGIVVARARVTIDATRSASRARAEVGETIEIRLTIANTGLLPVSGLLVEDRLPGAAIAPGEPAEARFALGTLRAGSTSVVTYPLPELPRGRFDIGPLSVRLGDPFGMVELIRTFPGSTRVVIVPRVVPLPRLPLPGGREELGANAVPAPGALGADDLSVRQYRPGDDLRKIHWRSSARADDLMVRQEQRPWQGDVTVLVDTRASAHRGSGSDSSFEWLVSAAASIAEHMSEQGLRVRLISDGYSATWPALGGAESLADLQLGAGARGRRGVVPRPAGLAVEEAADADSATLIALVGMTDDGIALADAESLAEVGGPARVLIAVRSPSWDVGSHRDDAHRATAGPTADRGAARSGDSAQQAALDRLRALGWRIGVAGRGDPVAGVWSAALGGSRHDDILTPLLAAPPAPANSTAAHSTAVQTTGAPAWPV